MLVGRSRGLSDSRNRFERHTKLVIFHESNILSRRWNLWLAKDDLRRKDIDLLRIGELYENSVTRKLWRYDELDDGESLKKKYLSYQWIVSFFLPTWHNFCTFTQSKNKSLSHAIKQSDNSAPFCTNTCKLCQRWMNWELCVTLSAPELFTRDLNWNHIMAV